MSAIRHRDANGFEHLEGIRSNVPHELGGAERDSFSFARLKGQAIVAESDVRVAEKRLNDFEKTRHFAKFEIDGEEWSLVRVDRERRLAEHEIEFNKKAVSAFRWRLYGGFQNPWKLRNIGEYRERAATAKESITTAREKIRSLQPIRDEVIRHIDEHRVDLKETAAEERQLAQSLNRAVDQEVILHVERFSELPHPQFNIQELRRLEENSITLADPQMLHLAEDSMQLHFGQTQEKNESLAARAMGRAVAADISLQDLTIRIERFSANREFVHVLFKGVDGEEKMASLRDLQPQSLTEKVLSYLSTKDRLEINAVTQALDDYYADLSSERDSLDQFAKGARANTQRYKESQLTLNQQSPVWGDQLTTPLPQFSAQEISQLENFAAQQSDSEVRAQFENLVSSIVSGRHGIDFKNNAHGAHAEMVASDLAQLRFQKDDCLERGTLIERTSVDPTGVHAALNGVAAAVETEAGSEGLASLL